MRVTGSSVCGRRGALAAAVALSLVATSVTAQEVGRPAERPEGDAVGEPGALPRPIVPPTTEGETEVEIEAEAQPDAPRPEPAPESVLPGPLPGPPDAATGERSRPDPGWTLREAPGSSPVALGGGPGQVVSVAAFCLGGRPWLALDLFPAPEGASVRADFGFSQERVEADALREEGAGGAYVIELAEGPLAGLLAGRDSVVALGIDGTQQGPLSLAGSSRTIPAALADCLAF
jgi:hypothetical protein